MLECHRVAIAVRSRRRRPLPALAPYSGRSQPAFIPATPLSFVPVSFLVRSHRRQPRSSLPSPLLVLPSPPPATSAGKSHETSAPNIAAAINPRRRCLRSSLPFPPPLPPRSFAAVDGPLQDCAVPLSAPSLVLAAQEGL